MAEPGIEPETSSLVAIRSDHPATGLVYQTGCAANLTIGLTKYTIFVPEAQSMHNMNSKVLQSVTAKHLTLLY
jgi:hypothetical protein